MNRLFDWRWSCLTVIAASIPAAAAAKAPAGVYYWEADRLVVAKALLEKDGDAQGMDQLRKAAERLREEADDCLSRGPYSVTDNDGVPPSGDKHDYISYSVYWWPDPKQPDGLPFIRRDGYTNEEQRAKGDREALKRMIEDAEALSLAYFFFGREEYAQHARKLLRTWFIDPKTKMNPHLQYAQAVLGREEGRGSGIIDARAFVELLDAVALLEDAGAIPADDQKALHEWFEAYKKWLLTSDYGDDERHATNNHGTWYSAQTARVALYVGDTVTAKELVAEARERLSDAVARDGRQSEELKRTRSLHYSMFHLAAFAYLARFGEALDVDLWRDKEEAKSRFERGLDFVTPYLLDQQKWPYEEIREYALSPQIVQLLYMAHARYQRPAYREALAKADRSEPDRDWSALLFAPMVKTGPKAAH